MNAANRNAAPGRHPGDGAKYNVSNLNFTALVREKARGQWPGVLSVLGVEPAALRNRHGPCPGCGGRDRFRFDDKDGRGGFICSGAGDTMAGDGFELLRHVHGWRFPEVVEQVARVLGMSKTDGARSRVTDAERRQWQETARLRQAEADARQQRKHEGCAEDARRLWEGAAPATQHAYLSRKGVQAHGLRQRGGLLLVPVRDAGGVLWNVQKTDGAGNKRFLPGRKKGLLHLLREPADDGLLIAEGYATAATIHEATGHATACAFDAGNLRPVAEALAERYPQARIIIAADNDVAGLRGARAAAVAVGGWLIAPPEKGDDWNDAGPDAVRAAVDALRQEVAA